MGVDSDLLLYRMKVQQLYGDVVDSYAPIIPQIETIDQEDNDTKKPRKKPQTRISYSPIPKPKSKKKNKPRRNSESVSSNWRNREQQFDTRREYAGDKLEQRPWRNSNSNGNHSYRKRPRYS